MSENEGKNGETVADDGYFDTKVVMVGYVNLQDGGIQCCVFLDASNDRVIPMYVGPAEAWSIEMALKKETSPRPMTHDLMKSVIDTLGATVIEAIIDDYDEEIYYGQIRIARIDARETMDIDARPSDCVAMAIRYDRTIRVSRKVMDVAAVPKKEIIIMGGEPPEQEM